MKENSCSCYFCFFSDLLKRKYVFSREEILRKLCETLESLPLVEYCYYLPTLALVTRFFFRCHDSSSGFFFSTAQFSELFQISFLLSGWLGWLGWLATSISVGCPSAACQRVSVWKFFFPNKKLLLFLSSSIYSVRLNRELELTSDVLALALAAAAAATN